MARKKVDSVDELLEQDTEAEDELNPDVVDNSSVVDDDLDEDSLTLDLDAIDEKAATFQPLPRGTYEAFIEEMNLKKSQAGNPMVEMRYRVKGGEYDKRLVFDHFVLNNEIGKARLKTMLTVLSFSQGGTFDLRKFVDEGEAVGTNIRIKLNITNRGGQKNNQVQEIMPASEDDPFFS